jgi:methanogenic corrinoid protein MtbC1
MMENKFEPLADSIRGGDIDGGIAVVRELVAGGTSPIEMFSECIEPTLNVLGEQFARLDIFLPELMIAGDVVNAIQEEVAPLLKQGDGASITKGKAVVATVYGDLHDIGKNMVSLMMQVNGFEMFDLGVDASPKDLVAKAEADDADLLCLSGLMMPSMPFMRETIEMARASAKIGNKIKIMVGGGPVTSEWAMENGADGYADDAMGAVKKAYELLGIKSMKAAS